MPKPVEENSEWEPIEKDEQLLAAALKAKTQGDLGLAEELLLRSMELGNAEAVAEMGVLKIEQGLYKQGQKYLLVAIEERQLSVLKKLLTLKWSGSADLGKKIYDKGVQLFSEKNQTYREWYKLAARLGYTKAASLLSLVENSWTEERKEWLMILAKAGDDTAMIELGDFFVTEGLLEQAEELLLEAEKLGSPYASFSIEQLKIAQDKARKSKEN